MNIRQHLERVLSAALSQAVGSDSPAIVAPAKSPQFGDYQANGVMAAAKTLKVNPRQLAAKFVESANLGGAAGPLEIAGPGFINIRLSPAWMEAQLAALAGDEKLGIDRPEKPQTVVVDYSAPNLAKEMHVGHLRSTIIGDALARVLDFAGHHVVRQNHVGDWGTQFGRVVLGMWHYCMATRKHEGEPNYVEQALPALQHFSPDDPAREVFLRSIRDRQEDDYLSDKDGTKHFEPFLASLESDSGKLSLEEMLPYYQFVNKVDTLAEGTGLDIPFREERIPYSALSSRVAQMVQDQGDLKRRNEQEFRAWKIARKITLASCGQIYHRLGIKLADADVRGESFYGGVQQDEQGRSAYSQEWNRLPAVIAGLREKNLLKESQGAQCVFLPEFANKEGEITPFIVQKSDEGFLYATTDLAAIRYRCGTTPPGAEHLAPPADRVLYVTDSRQAQHFQMLFAVARKAGFAPATVTLEHVAFGMMLGTDNRPFKTRAGGTIKLMDLLKEATERARKLVDEKDRDLPEGEKQKIADVVGIGAIKYADLAQNRLSDYVFSFDKMLSLDGNTAPYMQYAYARIRSIFRKAAGGSTGFQPVQSGGVESSPVLPTGTGYKPVLPISFSVKEPAERALAMKILQFPETIHTVVQECMPNVLCAYLYDLAGAFTGFYENCPVLTSDEPVRSQRLALCDLASRVIRTSLNLLGIATIEQM
jgi:arginyl-tRNA synthetase